jgi:hypothetical protein
MYGSTWGTRELDIGFATVDGVELRVRYSVQREPLASARARVPALRDLPDAGVWKFLATPAPVIAQR